MNDNEAKFLLRAFRPDGSDVQDPAFAGALAQTEKNPALREWLESEKAFDRTIATKLREVQPPPGLRDAILAGGRASQRHRAWWKNPGWLALAASVAIILTVSLRLSHSGPSAHDFAEFAIHELATTHNSSKHDQPAEFRNVQARFTNTALPLPNNTRLDASELHRLGCRTVSFSGHEVFEICFERDGQWFHLYATPAKAFAPGAAVARSLVMTKGNFTATAWKDAQFVYALVTDEGAEALRRLL